LESDTEATAEVDLEMKSKALAQCEISGAANGRKPWHKVELMAFPKEL
jgi:hypothetical protein